MLPREKTPVEQHKFMIIGQTNKSWKNALKNSRKAAGKCWRKFIAWSLFYSSCKLTVFFAAALQIMQKKRFNYDVKVVMF
jgi:hypothetical protein